MTAAAATMLCNTRRMVAAQTEVESAFAAGDDTALAYAYRQWGGLIHHIALRTVGNSEDAADITQATFVSAWRSRDSFDPERASLKTWLVAIARRRIADHLRTRHVQTEIPTDQHSDPLPPPRAQSTRTDMNAVVDRLVVRDQVAELPEPAQTVVRLAFFNELTHTEIATATGLPIGTVKSHLRRSLAKMRKGLDGSRDG